jgi:hypothetical protein
MADPTWPFSVPFGWSVEWDPSPAGSDPRNDFMLRAESGVDLATCSRDVKFLPL